jgi:hypothetical protein
MSADKILLSTQTELREYASQVPFANISTLHKSKEIEQEAQKVLHSLSELKKRQDLSGAELIEREEVLYKRLHHLYFGKTLQMSHKCPINVPFVLTISRENHHRSIKNPCKNIFILEKRYKCPINVP